MTSTVVGRPRAYPIPLNCFAMSFGLAGLAQCWVTLARQGHSPMWIGDAWLALSAAVWVITLAFYLWGIAASPKRFAADLTHPILGPFASLIVIPPMILAALGVAPHAFVAGRTLVDVFIGLTVLLGAWFTGQWIYRPIDYDKFHPGYFLPTAAGGLVASGTAATVGQHRLGEVMLGYGVICWVILGSMILARLFFRPMLPDPLVPTIAIEIAPPAVASIAWFALNGGRVDLIASLLAGYGTLMALAQLRLLPAFLRLSFGLGFWAFTFTWSSVATSTLFWINIQRPPGHLVYTWIVVALITTLVGGIAVRTAIALVRGQLLPPLAPPEPPRQPATPR